MKVEPGKAKQQQVKVFLLLSIDPPSIEFPHQNICPKMPFLRCPQQLCSLVVPLFHRANIAKLSCSW